MSEPQRKGKRSLWAPGRGGALPPPPPPLVHSWLGPPAVSQQPLGPLGKPKPLAEACPVPNPLCP